MEKYNPLDPSITEAHAKAIEMNSDPKALEMMRKAAELKRKALEFDRMASDIIRPASDNMESQIEISDQGERVFEYKILGFCQFGKSKNRDYGVFGNSGFFSRDFGQIDKTAAFCLNFTDDIKSNLGLIRKVANGWEGYSARGSFEYDSAGRPAGRAEIFNFPGDSHPVHLAVNMWYNSNSKNFGTNKNVGTTFENGLSESNYKDSKKNFASRPCRQVPLNEIAAILLFGENVLVGPKNLYDIAENQALMSMVDQLAFIIVENFQNLHKFKTADKPTLLINSKETDANHKILSVGSVLNTNECVAFTKKVLHKFGDKYAQFEYLCLHVADSAQRRRIVECYCDEKLSELTPLDSGAFEWIKRVGTAEEIQSVKKVFGI